MTVISRRSVLKMGGLAAASSLGGLNVGAARFPADARCCIPILKTPARADVELLDGPLLEQFSTHHTTLLAMDEDALLKPFRAAAGLPTPGEDLGGWYNASAAFNPPSDMHGFIPGHSFGQYISSMARAYAVTGDEPTRRKIDRLVEGFAPTITPRFYNGYTLPAYTFDKINVGLSDAFAHAGNPVALRILGLATDAALPHLPNKALSRPEMAARPHPNIAYTWDESYTLPENLYLAWRRGAGERYRALAERFLLDDEYFDPLARGENVLAGRHAYSHVNALSSAAQAYLTNGDSKHLRAARNGFDFVLEQSFATGGWGPNEGFIVPGSGALGDSINSTHASFETPCGAYGHCKIARYLAGITGDSRYGDSIERVLYNTVLGALPMKPDGTAFYYADYSGSGAKTYFEYRCPCCSGTLGQMVADYGISSYLVNERSVFINLYVPSRLRWRLNGRRVTLAQTTSYPLSPDINISVDTASPQDFSIALRIPAWAGAATEVAVNDRRVAEPVIPGTFHEIRRTWKAGDRIQVRLDMHTRLEAVDEQHPSLLAALHGPLALFAVGERFLPLRRAELLSIQQLTGGSSQWRVRTGEGEQLFRPYFAVGSGTTRLYQPLRA